MYRSLHHSARLPVLFWIHGGGFTNGSGNQFDGSTFAAQNDEVAVTINYRLNVFGFLALPQLISNFPAAGDIGLLDQQAALRWTHRNSAAFGGDPRAVTIAGESAGGWSVCDQLASPTVAGLFHAAIIESGSCVQSTLAQAESTATAFASAVGCTDSATVVACLDAKSSVREGNPNYEDGVGWPRYNPTSNPVLSLQPHGNRVIHTFSAQHHCGFWTSVEQIPSTGGIPF